PFPVTRRHLAQFLKDYDRFPVRRYSVTIPHKEMAVSFASFLDTTVALTQAANTLVRSGDNFLQQGITPGPPIIASTPIQGGTRWSAYNTDCQAAIDTLLASLPPPPEGGRASISSRLVLLLGA